MSIRFGHWVKRKLPRQLATLGLLLTILGAHSGSFASEQDFEAATAPPSSELPIANDPSTNEPSSVRAQFTNVTQSHPQFRSPYSGTNSLESNRSTKETTDLTLYAGTRLWRGAEFWINPEMDQGFGLSSTVGVAGFPSGEAYKVGANVPYLRIPRAFIRHVVPLGGTEKQIESTANQLGGSRTSDNFTLTIGKFSVVDIFDTNRYAHDPRIDFMNWAVIDAGAFDYAADAWGFTYGATAEWTQSWWTLRGGLFQLSRIPNGKVISVDFRNYSLVGEVESRYEWLDRPGKLKLLGFLNQGRMARYDEALQLARQTGAAPDVAHVRRAGLRPGISINLEQELAFDMGTFARVSLDDGNKEAYEFTEINKSISFGLSFKGDRWGRPNDTSGIALVANALSRIARRYFSAGGLGILIGDGRLNYSTERIAETYYSFQLGSHAVLALDYQHVVNPAYNKDRGPVSIYGVRLHSDF